MYLAHAFQDVQGSQDGDKHTRKRTLKWFFELKLLTLNILISGSLLFRLAKNNILISGSLLFRLAKNNSLLLVEVFQFTKTCQQGFIKFLQVNVFLTLHY